MAQKVTRTALWVVRTFVPDAGAFDSNSLTSPTGIGGFFNDESVTVPDGVNNTFAFKNPVAQILMWGVGGNRYRQADASAVGGNLVIRKAADIHNTLSASDFVWCIHT